MHKSHLFGAWLGIAAAIASFGESDARACGGCIAPPEDVSVITDEKMILSISKDQTTLYDEIEYSGSPSSFAWVLPIKGTVTVGLSADILFATLESLTTSEVVAPTPSCPGTSCKYYLGGAPGAGGSGGTGGAGGGVTVTSQKQVGPYETVQLQSSDGSALTNWLSAHGYVLPAADAPVIDAYVAQHFNFLALKLVPGEGVQAMQPVRVTSTGASISLPLHMVAVGTGATTGITIWVVADGRWEPQNFPTFTITDPELTWDWTTGSSNYETLRLSKEAALKGRGWQIESSLELNQASIQDSLLTAIEYGGASAGLYTAATSSDGGADGGDAATGVVDAGDDADASAAIDQAAIQDLAVLFAGVAKPNVRITRMRSDVAHSALSNDMFLQAASDQSELTNVHYPAKQTGKAPCPVCVESGDGGEGEDGGVEFGAPSTESSGCSTTGSLDGSGAAFVVLSGLGGIALIRSRRRRR
jgi:MYXO-CTERM domain-containing protein